MRYGKDKGVMVVARHAARRPWYYSPWFLLLVFALGVVLGWFLPHSHAVVNQVVYRNRPPVTVPHVPHVMPHVHATVNAGAAHAAHLAHMAHLHYVHVLHVLHDQHVRYVLDKNTLW